jgi:hypothetical protein
VPSAHRPGTILPSREPALTSGLSAFCIKLRWTKFLSELEDPMWVYLFLFLLRSSSAPLPIAPPAPTVPPSIVVQAVDPDYLPIVGATVSVSSLANKSHSVSAHTGDKGYAEFFVPPESDYSIEVRIQNFKDARLKRLHISKPESSARVAYVQIVMKIAGRTVEVD